jgi:Na+/melibiose symporter-like transporter
MNWLAFAASFVGMLCVMLLWQALDTWIQWRAPRLCLVGSGLLFLVIAITGTWLLPNQSRGIFFGAVTGLMIAGAIDAVRRRELRRRAAGR